MDVKELRIVYMGTPEFAVPPLKMLVEQGYNVVGVMTVPDKPAGRGLQIQQSAVKQYAVEAGLPVLQPEKLKDPEFVEQFRALNADLAIVIAFRMLPEVIWSMPPLGTFNLHASLLPQYRGAAPINWAIINGETKTGLTTFMLNHEIDKGAIVARREVDILPDDTIETLHDRLRDLGPALVVETIGKIASGKVVPVEQESIDVGELKSAPKIFKENCRIDWSREGESIRNLVRGLSPYPTAWSEMAVGGATPLQVKIFSVSFKSGDASELGTVLSDGKTYLKVACVDGSVYINELQVAGKKRMSIADFLRGFQHSDDIRFL